MPAPAPARQDSAPAQRASACQRDQLPNHALLDQGGACGAAGPASAAGSALAARPPHAGPRHETREISTAHPAHKLESVLGGPPALGPGHAAAGRHVVCVATDAGSLGYLPEAGLTMTTWLRMTVEGAKPPTGLPPDCGYASGTGSMASVPAGQRPPVRVPGQGTREAALDLRRIGRQQSVRWGKRRRTRTAAAGEKWPALMRSRRSLGRVGLRGQHLARGVIHHGQGLGRSGRGAAREEHDIIPLAVSGRRPQPPRHITKRPLTIVGAKT